MPGWARLSPWSWLRRVAKSSSKGSSGRVDQAKRAGLEAQARTEEELIRRFRAETGDPDALRDQETLTRVETAQAIADLGLAPGASRARDTGGA